MAKKKSMPQKIRPNIKHQVILVMLAFAGIGIGYGVGFIFKKPPPEPAKNAVSSIDTPARPTIDTPKYAPESGISAPSPVLPEIAAQSSGQEKVRAYEEALPDNIVEGAIPPIISIIPIKPTLPPPPLGQQNLPNQTEQATDKTQATQTISSDPAEQASFRPDQQTNQPSSDALLPTPAAIRTWQINALPFKVDSRPKIAIVIDDMGVDRGRSTLAVALPAPLTMSYLTYGRDLATQTASARKAGHELLMHMPMEPSSTTFDPGPNVLLSGMDETELIRNLRWNLDQFDGYVGINNHMGSRFTSDYKGMLSVLKELNSRGLMFLDSLTSANSKGSRAARTTGVPHLVRNVFLDHEDDLDAINSRLRDTELLALKQGHAIAIGHPRDNTLVALTSWLETIESKGFQLVPLTALLKIGPKTVAEQD